MRGLFNRPTGDLLILLIAITICVSVLATGATIAIIEITNPEVNTSKAGSAIGDVLNTLIGLLAGFLAGRTDLAVTRQKIVEDRDRIRQEAEKAVEQ